MSRRVRYSSPLTPHPSLLVGLLAVATSWAAEVDSSKLPPAVTNQVDFLREIKPILDLACLRCHGPEKPKSHFRIDSREAVLRGGDSGIAVVPGESGKSPLIHYVARLVEDMEMPPAGKGDPLTTPQIALLRAWIDQGLVWGLTGTTTATEIRVSPTLRWFSVSGDERKFREQQWRREGWDGGVTEFQLTQHADPNRHVTVTGHALRDDYRVTLALEQKELGFVRFGFEQYRKYYDDSGGYYAPFNPPFFRLDRDLHLDIGKAWAEVGLTLPAWPRLVAGYEHQYTEGAKSLLQWLPENQGGPLGPKNIFPAAKEIDQRLHLLRIDLEHELAGFRLEDNFRYEIYDLETERTTVARLQGTPNPLRLVQEGHEHHQWANAFRFEKQPKEGIFFSGGYLYRSVDGEASFDHVTVDATTQTPVFGQLWNASGIVLEQSSHTFNLNSQLGPWEGMTFSAGLQTEWSRQEGVGNVNLDEGDPNDPLNILFIPATVSSDLDRFSTEENAALRFTYIPFTVLFADARFKQEEISQFEDQTSEMMLGGADFLRDTDARDNWREYRAGFHMSPWRRVSLGAHYLRRDRRSDYDHERDEFGGVSPGSGYSAFINARDTFSEGVETKIVLRPLSWLKSTLGYKLTATDYETDTDVLPVAGLTGGRVLAGNYDAHNWNVNLTLTPWRRLYLSTTFTYQKTRTETEVNDVPAVVPYRGQLYNVLTSATFVWNDKTDVQASYYYSQAGYGQDNELVGLPLGIDYYWHRIQAGLRRRVSKHIVAHLQYAYQIYREGTSAGYNDYTAHGVFGTVTVQWP